MDNLNQNGVAVNLSDVTSTMFLAAFCMLFGLLLSIFIFYSKPREYQEIAIKNMDYENIQMTRKEWGVLAGLILTLVCQIMTQNLPLSGLLGFILMIVLGGVSYKKVDLVFDDGLYRLCNACSGWLWRGFKTKWSGRGACKFRYPFC